MPGITAPEAYALGLVSALLLFASILAHEFGHALVARRRGVEIEEIDLWLLGGVARMSRRPTSARDELRFALAAPAVTALVAVVAAISGALALGLPGSTPAAPRAVIRYQAEVNLPILGFNLVPACRSTAAGSPGRCFGVAAATSARPPTPLPVWVAGFGYLLIAFGSERLTLIDPIDYRLLRGVSFYDLFIDRRRWPELILQGYRATRRTLEAFDADARGPARRSGTNGRRSAPSVATSD